MPNKRTRDRKKKSAAADPADSLETMAVPDSAELLKQSDRFTNLMLGIFWGIAGILILVTAISAVNISRKQAAEIRVQGVVVDIMVGTDENENEFYFPVVEYPLLDGTRKTNQLTQGSSMRDYERGQSVTIRYNPEQPDEARIQSLASTALIWVLPIITGVMGAVFLAITTFTWRVFGREKENRFH